MHYRAIQHLSTENVELNVKVHFVIYSIDTSMEVPHIKFYLVKDCEEPTEEGVGVECELATLETYLRTHEYLTFPSIDYNASQHFLFTLYCHGVVESLFHEDREYVSCIQQRGHLVDEEEGRAFAFFEIFPTTTEAEYMTRETFIWPVLMDEILRTKCVCDIPIHSEVTSFFMEHPSFIYLSGVDDTDADDNTQLVHPMPVAVYFPVPTNMKKTQFTAMFGVTRNEEQGNHFLFYSYNRAMDLLRAEGSGKHGLVRCALYPGNTTTDKEEFCQTTDQQDTFDTLYHGNEYQAKRYEQQKPMSYHHVLNHTQL